ILEQNHGWLPGTACAREPPDQVEEASLPCLGTERWRGPLGIRNAEEVEHEWQLLGERLVEQKHSPCDLVAGSPRRVVLGDAEVAAKELEHGEQRHGFPVGDAVRLVDRNLSYAAALGEFVAEPTLPRPRLGDDPDDLGICRNRLFERGLENCHLALATD